MTSVTTINNFETQR